MLSLVLAAAAPALAQPAEGSREKQEGEYGGVGPGQARPEAGKGRRAPAKATLTWLGFTAREGGGGELFAQAASSFTVSQRLEGRMLIVTLEGLKKLGHNTRRPLDLRFFDVAVARAQAFVVTARRGKKGAPGRPAGVELRIQFKDPRDAREAVLRTDTVDGLFHAYLGFGAPSAPAAAAASTGSSMADPE